MTWIRVDTTLPAEPVMGKLAERLHIEVPTAIGLYISTQLGFGEHQKNGMVDAVADTTLEQWAGWRGEPGAWAAAFRQLCVQLEAEHKDPVGCLRGWWRNQKLVERQLKNAQHRRGEEDDVSYTGALAGRKPAENRHNVGAGLKEHVAAAAANEDGNEQQQQLQGAREAMAAITAALHPVSTLDYVRRVVGAANRGMGQNPAFKGRGRGYNELTCSAQDAHLAWIEDGVPVEVAERVVFDRAKRYRPSTHRPQPGGLAYFDRGVREAWDKELSHLASAGLQVQSSTGEALTEAERMARQLEAEVRQEAQHG